MMDECIYVSLNVSERKQKQPKAQRYSLNFIISMPFKPPKPRVTAYTAFKPNSTFRKISSSNEKPLQYQSTTIALFLFTATNTTLK